MTPKRTRAMRESEAWRRCGKVVRECAVVGAVWRVCEGNLPLRKKMLGRFDTYYAFGDTGIGVGALIMVCEWFACEAEDEERARNA